MRYYLSLKDSVIIMSMKRALLWTVHACVLVAALGTCGCEALPVGKPIEIAGLVFRNSTRTALQNVQLSVERTGGSVLCSPIPGGRDCSTVFPGKLYQGNPVRISWEQNGISYSSEEIYVQLPENLASKKPAMALVIIGDRGSVSAQLVQ